MSAVKRSAAERGRAAPSSAAGTGAAGKPVKKKRSTANGKDGGDGHAFVDATELAKRLQGDKVSPRHVVGAVSSDDDDDAVGFSEKRRAGGSSDEALDGAAAPLAPLAGAAAPLGGASRMATTALADALPLFHTHKRIPAADVQRIPHNRNTVTCVASRNNTVFFGDKSGAVVSVELPSLRRFIFGPALAKGVQVLSLAVSDTSESQLHESLGLDRTSVDMSVVSFVAAGCSDGRIHIWNAATRRHAGELAGHSAAVTGLCFRQHTHTLHSASADGCLRLWHVAELHNVDRFYGHRGPISCIASLGRERCVTGGVDRTVRYWKVDLQTQVEYAAQMTAVDAVAMLDDNTIISGSANGTISVFDISRRSASATVKFAHGYANRGDGTGLEDAALSLRDEATQRVAMAARRSGGDNDHNNGDTTEEGGATEERPWADVLGNGITAMAVIPYSNLLVTGSNDGFLRFWKLGGIGSDAKRGVNATIAPIGVVEVDGCVNAVAFSPDGHTVLAAVGKEPRLGRWVTISAALNGVAIVALSGATAKSKRAAAAAVERLLDAAQPLNPRALAGSQVDEAFVPVVQSKLVTLKEKKVLERAAGQQRQQQTQQQKDHRREMQQLHQRQREQAKLQAATSSDAAAAAPSPAATAATAAKQPQPQNTGRLLRPPQPRKQAQQAPQAQSGEAATPAPTPAPAVVAAAASPAKAASNGATPVRAPTPVAVTPKGRVTPAAVASAAASPVVPLASPTPVPQSSAKKAAAAATTPVASPRQSRGRPAAPANTPASESPVVAATPARRLSVFAGAGAATPMVPPAPAPTPQTAPGKKRAASAGASSGAAASAPATPAQAASPAVVRLSPRVSATPDARASTASAGGVSGSTKKKRRLEGNDA